MNTSLPLDDKMTPRLSSEAAEASLEMVLTPEQYEAGLALPESLRMDLYGDIMTYGPAAERISGFFVKVNEKLRQPDGEVLIDTLIQLGGSWQKSLPALDDWDPRGEIRNWSERVGFYELNQWFVNLGYKTSLSISNNVSLVMDTLLSLSRGITFMCWMMTTDMLHPEGVREEAWAEARNDANEILNSLGLALFPFSDNFLSLTRQGE